MHMLKVSQQNVLLDNAFLIYVYSGTLKFQGLIFYISLQ